MIFLSVTSTSADYVVSTSYSHCEHPYITSRQVINSFKPWYPAPQQEMAIDDRQSERSDLLVSEKKRNNRGIWWQQRGDNICQKLLIFLYRTSSILSHNPVQDRLAVPCAVSTDLSTAPLLCMRVPATSRLDLFSCHWEVWKLLAAHATLCDLCAGHGSRDKCLGDRMQVFWMD